MDIGKYDVDTDARRMQHRPKVRSDLMSPNSFSMGASVMSSRASGLSPGTVVQCGLGSAEGNELKMCVLTWFWSSASYNSRAMAGSCTIYDH